MTYAAPRDLQSPDPGGTDLPPSDDRDDDEVPDTPPTEPQPIPIQEPPPGPDEERGPYIACQA